MYHIYGIWRLTVKNEQIWTSSHVELFWIALIELVCDTLLECEYDLMRLNEH